MLYAQARRARFDEIDAELLAGARVIEGVLRTTFPPARPPAPRPSVPDSTMVRMSAASRPRRPPRWFPPGPGGPPGEPGLLRRSAAQTAAAPAARPGAPRPATDAHATAARRAQSIQPANFVDGSLRRGGRAALLRGSLRRRRGDPRQPARDRRRCTARPGRRSQIRVALAQSRHAARGDAARPGAHHHPGRPADSPRAGRPAADGVAARAHRARRVSRPAWWAAGGCRRAPSGRSSR